MASNNFFRSDLPALHNVVQNAMIVYPKEAILAHLRDYFSHDSFYHYSADHFGFPNTPDHTDLPLLAGLHDNVTTRLFIGENYRDDTIFYPAILIKHGGSKYVPISINREESTVEWEVMRYEDGYGNSTFFKNPKSFIFAGAWEGSIIIDIKTRSLRARDDLIQEVSIALTDIFFKSLQKAGVICKPVSVSSTSEEDDRNDKIFKQTITLDIRTEWRRSVPVSNLVEVITFAVDFVNLSNPNAVSSPNSAINTSVTLLDILSAG